MNIPDNFFSNAANAYESAARYSVEVPNGNRSSNRTDMLHRSIEHMFQDLLEANGSPKGDWEVKHELPIPCSRGGTFTVDIVFEHKSGFSVHVLVKSIEKSYNKNRQNYANGLAGEVIRIFGDDSFDRDADIAVSWTMLPEKVLAGKRIEKSNYAKDDVRMLRRMHPSFDTGVHTMRAIPEQRDFEPNSESFVDSFTGDVEERNKEELSEQLKEFLENVKSSVQLRENSKEG